METMRERFSAVAVDLLDTRSDVAIVLADIGVSSFEAAGATKRHSDRVVNVGIREQLQIGVAAGLALEGLFPIVHGYAPFLVQRPWEQIKLDFGHQGVAGALVSVGASHDVADNGRTHQAPEDVALIATLPGWDIVVPGHPDEAESALRTAVGKTTPTYIRLSESANTEAYDISGGSATLVRSGALNSATIVAVGPVLEAALAAAERFDLTVLYTATPRPLDADTLRSVAHRDVIVVEPYLEGTSAGEVSRALEDRPHRLLSIGTTSGELRRYGSRAEHDDAHGLGAAGISRRIESFLGTYSAEITE